MIASAQTKKQKQRGKPNANAKESGYIRKPQLPLLPATRRAYPAMNRRKMPSLLSNPRKMKEPQKVVGYDEYAGGYEGRGGEGDEGPAGGEVLEVDCVAED
jgi:hypothetical protein